MIDELIDCVDSLTALMESETEELKSGTLGPDGASIAEAKGRLTASLEKEMARLERGGSDWIDTLSGEDRGVLVEKMQALEQVAQENAAMIDRSLRMSGEIIAAISDEVRRVSGQRSVGYRPSGALHESARTAPISVNTAF